ncbi:putative nascent polypeptide-associated complex subunit alpha [Sesbania bispinosa]|nr:putative nascent polypeptide-associated complex subunit alpha [Sesbania bispinosa]
MAMDSATVSFAVAVEQLAVHGAIEEAPSHLHWHNGEDGFWGLGFWGERDWDWGCTGFWGEGDWVAQGEGLGILGEEGLGLHAAGMTVGKTKFPLCLILSIGLADANFSYLSIKFQS